MKITKPKKQLFAKSTIYYVSSDSGKDKHIVVQNSGTLFCDCRDFVTRRLPLFGTSSFSLCKHGEFVKLRSNVKKALEIQSPKKYAVYYIGQEKTFLSMDIPGIFDTKEEAQNALNKHNAAHPHHQWNENRKVMETGQ